MSSVIILSHSVFYTLKAYMTMCSVTFAGENKLLCISVKSLWILVSYFANKEGFHLHLAHCELGDVEGRRPKCLIHYIIGIH